MTQVWRELLFAHWRVDPAQIQAILPEGLEVDTHQGDAWVAVVPFRMTGVRPRFVPAVPGISDFAELNVRTYVVPRHGDRGKPGVYFWSLEASNPLAVWAARRFFHLPYMNATMRCERKGEWIEYESVRTHAGEPKAEFRGRYRKLGKTQKDERVKWLTERYCLYTTGPGGELYRGEIHHEPWPLYDAQAEVEANTMAGAAGLQLPDEKPLLHYSEAIEVVVWPLELVR